MINEKNPIVFTFNFTKFQRSLFFNFSFQYDRYDNYDYVPLEGIKIALLEVSASLPFSMRLLTPLDTCP